MVPRPHLVIRMNRARLITANAALILIAGCSDKPNMPNSCIINERQFCVGTDAKQYEVSVQEQRAVGTFTEGFTYVVRGFVRERPQVHFVAVVRNLNSPDLDSSIDRLHLCEELSINAADCTRAPLKTAKQKYQVLYEGYSVPVEKGIRIDLLAATGVPEDIANTLAFPCAGLENGTRVCGPNLGSCIRRRNSVGCDFQDNVWNTFWKWGWHYL
jgi:hypothetical protein